MIFFPLVHCAPAARSDLPAIWTAIGTMALAIVTVVAIITTIVITRGDRQRADSREQLAEAYAVQVVLVRYAEGSDDGSENQDASYLEAMIVNRGHYTITRIEARFSLDGRSLIAHSIQVRMAGIPSLPTEMRAQVLTARPAEAASASDLLTPWDTGMRIRTHAIAVKRLTDPQTIVRWTDQWGTRWEHRRGEVRKIKAGEPWSV